MPILSFFRTYNVISVHCEPRKGVDRQVVEKHTAKQTQHGMCLKKAKTAKKKYIYKQCTDRLLHIIIYFYTIPQFSKVQAADAHGKKPPSSFPDSNELLQ